MKYEASNDGYGTAQSGVTATETGTISSSGTTVTGVGTLFTTIYAVGGTITASGQTQTISAIASATSLTTTVAFNPVISAGTSFIGPAFPWVNIPRTTNTPSTAGSFSARTACQALGQGYDLISNSQWQTIARNIAGVATNWSTGTVGTGELNRGHSDSAPNNALSPSSDDTSGNCSGTGQSCSSTTWDSQRRTHVLSNGNMIWDFAGNVWQWVSNDSNVSNGVNGYISEMSGGDIRQTRYGALSSTICTSPATNNYCGMGYGYFAYTAGAVLRGGNWVNGVNAGVFAANLTNAPTSTGSSVGFRCVFVP